MDLIFIHGPVASGKLTVGRSLSAKTGVPLFHNHLVVDAVGAVFPFGSPAFRRLRESLWLQMFQAAAEAGQSLIFTFAPETTVSAAFPQITGETVRRAGGNVRFIALTVPETEQDLRIANASRAAFGKLRDPDLLRTLRAGGAFDYPTLPSEIAFDTAALTADQIATDIARHLAA